MILPNKDHAPDKFSSLEEIKNHKWNDNLAAPINQSTLRNIRKFIDDPNTSLEDKASAIRIFFNKKYERNIFMKKDIEMFHQYHQYKINQ